MSAGPVPATLFEEAERLEAAAAEASWRSYSEYRDSGVEWLGRVPKHWDKKRLKYAVDLINDKTDDSDGLQYIGLEQIESWTGRLIEPETPIVPDGTACRFEADDVLFGKLRPYLAKAYRAATRGVCTAEALVLRSRDTIPNYLRYYLLTRQYIEVVDGSTYGSKMPRANWQFIGALPCLLPPPDEQRVIAAFLDRKTREIDALIDKKRRLIELLHEKRAALISHAVTKGLNPDAPMKPSGVEWLGELPEHWEVKSLKFLAKKNGRSFTDGDWIETPYVTYVGIRLLQCGNVGTGLFEEQGFRYISEETFAELNCTEVEANDVLICRMRSSPTILAGRACLAPELGGRMITAVDNCILKVDDHIDPRFVVYQLTVGSYLDFIENVARGGTRDRISRSMLGSIRVAVPPRQEQSKIADYLDERLRGVVEMLQQCESAMSLLTQYRQSLISAAVTGKIDVRGESDP